MSTANSTPTSTGHDSSQNDTHVATLHSGSAAVCEPVYPNQQAVLSTLQSLDSLYAVICAHSGRVLFASNKLHELFPQIEQSENWLDAIAGETALINASKAFQRSGKETHSVELKLGSANRRVSMKRVNADNYLVDIGQERALAKNLHEYMEARDSLFSTSRTISVSEMATTLAHELNTPIGTITNILRVIQKRLAQPDTPADVIEIALTRALEQAQFTQSVINRIRDFTQSRRPSYRHLDIRQQISEAVALLDWLLSSNDCSIETNIPEYPIVVDGDPTMLQQVLINLMRNAVDAMAKQSQQRHICINAETVGNRVRIAITDNGMGLEAGEDTLFVPFATTKSNGMGVGLNICRSFVELHQGRLWLSPNETGGCTSFIELPIVENVQNEFS